MKIIDLLNKIADSEEVPKKIKYDDNFYIYDERFEDYFCEEKDLYLICKIIGEDSWKMSFALNIGVEIIEDKKIETINNFTSNVGAVDETNVEEYIHKLFEQLILYLKINEIIKYINKGD